MTHLAESVDAASLEQSKVLEPAPECPAVRAHRPVDRPAAVIGFGRRLPVGWQIALVGCEWIVSFEA